MKNRNMFSKSMLLVMIPVLLISFIIVIVTQQGIKEYFERESFKVLNNELETLTNYSGEVLVDSQGRDLPGNRPAPPLLSDPPSLKKPKKSARYAIIVETNYGEFHVLSDARSFIKLNAEDIIGNDEWPLHGQTSIHSETVFYAITPIDEDLIDVNIKEKEYKTLYYLTYISESYSKDLTYEVMTVFVIGLVTLIVLVSIVLFTVFKNISKRLKLLEKGTQKIGRGEFDSKISVEPYDEIGRLGDAMNRMGKQLGMIQDEQAENFQMISHELKTPIMVMQGYIDALINDQYPSGTKEATMKILVDELCKLENLTKDILFLNKAEYLAKNNIVLTNIRLSEIFKEVTLRLNRDSNIDIEISGEHELVADKESWIRVIENIISNQLRYAKTEINITLSSYIKIKNDGEHIEDKLLDKIKKPFVKGESGRSGLGLTIIDHTLKLYDYELTIDNCIDGVEYIISKSKTCS